MRDNQNLKFARVDSLGKIHHIETKIKITAKGTEMILVSKSIILATVLIKCLNNELCTLVIATFVSVALLKTFTRLRNFSVYKRQQAET